MKINFISNSFHKLNHYMHFINLGTFLLGIYNYKYFNEVNKKKFTDLSLKNSLLIVIDSINHSNVNKMYYVIPSILSKLFVLLNSYKLFGKGILDEKAKEIFGAKKYYNLKINDEKLSDKEMLEIDLVDNESMKLAKLFEINQKQKFNKFEDDKITKILNENEIILNYLINLGVGLTSISILI
jgi:hypothetical protein